MDEQLRLADMDVGSASGYGVAAATASEVPDAPPRLRRVDRRQVRMIACSLDELLAADHTARTIWRGASIGLAIGLALLV